MSTITRNDHAVSPVIGVMLMIVVTIIIAAIVSAFAGNMGAGEHKAPVASLEVTPSTDCNGTIEFHLTSGNELNLTDTAVQLSYNGETITLSDSDTMQLGYAAGGGSNTGAISSCPPVGGSYSYLVEEGGSSDGYISAGDRFVLTADNNIPTTTTALGQLVFQPLESGVNTTFALPYNARVSYMVIDKPSGKAIQTGTFVMRNS